MARSTKLLKLVWRYCGAETGIFLDCVKSDTPVSFPAANLDEAVKNDGTRRSNP